MATTSPDGLRTPDPGDPYNLVPDLQTLANNVQSALNNKSARPGTAAQRAAFLSTAPNGFLWQDTDSIKMIWRKDGAAWVPAVWRWSGTTAQMNAFTQAPNGFEWFNTTDNSNHVRLGGSWKGGWTTVLSAVAGSPRAMYRLNPNTGKVEMRGIGSKGTGYGLFTLPVGMRPSVTLNFHDPASGPPSSNIIIQIISTGLVSYSLNTTATLSLDNVSFAPVP